MSWYNTVNIRQIQSKIEQLEYVKKWLEMECETDTNGFEMGAIGKIQAAIEDLEEACERMANKEHEE